MTNKIKTFIVSGSFALLLLPFAVKAAEVKAEANVYLPQAQTVDGNLYAAGNDITIDGEIKGDLIAAAQTITINGRLEGDLIAAAQTITVNGEVNGNIRIAANSAYLNGPVARNVNYIGNTLAVGQNAKIGWDLLSSAINTNIMGVINGNYTGTGNSIILSGKIGKNFNFAKSQNTQIITLAPQATINGNLYYNDQAQLNLQEGSSIAGQVNPIKNKTDNNKTVTALWSYVYSVFAAIIIGLILIKPGKKITLGMNELIKKQTTSVIVWGVLAFLIVPMAALILIVTIIGIPLALMLIAAWLLMLWLGKIITAIFIGQALITRFSKHSDREANLTLSLILGIVLAYLIFAIPYIGWIISLAATCIGLGAFMIYVRQRNAN